MDSDIMDSDTQFYSTHIKELEEVQALIDRFDFEDLINAEEFVYCVDNEITTEMPTNEEILKAVLPNNQQEESLWIFYHRLLIMRLLNLMKK
ncbi:unnamed protein product [Rhizophagus irregularis]|nr:unnamed protein product [Rhizophagus irregularis]